MQSKRGERVAAMACCDVGPKTWCSIKVDDFVVRQFLARGAVSCAVVSDQKPRRLRTTFRAPHPVMDWTDKNAVLTAVKENGGRLTEKAPTGSPSTAETNADALASAPMLVSCARLANMQQMS